MEEGAMMTPTPAAVMSQATTSSSSSSSSRPTLGFPLGTALLLIVIFCLSGIFSCCYHWDKLRSLRARASRHSTDLEDPHTHDQEHIMPTLSSPTLPVKLALVHQSHEQEKKQSLPVIMPGDQIPKFMAWPRACQQR
ncbi:uncharacterized protein At5g65660-like [Dioscorea cayenensis subsp. rotundata]|uniref:Uncharacterized protein At5g65660-like n=1 Tax=Dioscorea cayennensis subsp. rotundata TaxID=55577 RepID=A0AB40ALG5_DIOCR|nr:uncharacterized protein At5g65660-like [Dioscorea cayenensis subsp. rotundata]